MAINTTSEIYGIQTPKPAQFSVKRKSTKNYGFKFPISDPAQGGYLKKSSEVDLVKSQLRQLLLTSRGERVMLPNYGTNLKNYIMEPLDQSTLSSIRREVLESFSSYATNVNVNKIQVFPGQTEALTGGNIIILKIFCSLKDEDAVSFEIKVDIT
jgi:phage baseplate assembly protein W